MTVATRYPHIGLNESGVPTIGTGTMKVIELVQAHIAYGWSPEELHFQFPHLSLGQIHSALAYYHDHREELDAEIEKGLKEADELRRAVGQSPLGLRLRSKDLR